MVCLMCHVVNDRMISPLSSFSHMHGFRDRDAGHARVRAKWWPGDMPTDLTQTVNSKTRETTQSCPHDHNQTVQYARKTLKYA